MSNRVRTSAEWCFAQTAVLGKIQGADKISVVVRDRKQWNMLEPCANRDTEVININLLFTFTLRFCELTEYNSIATLNYRNNTQISSTAL